jgi:hypothetical protein
VPSKRVDTARRTRAIDAGIARRAGTIRAELRARQAAEAAAEDAVVASQLKSTVAELLKALDELDPQGAQAAKERRETRRLLKHYRENIEPFIPRG